MSVTPLRRMPSRRRHPMAGAVATVVASLVCGAAAVSAAAPAQAMERVCSHWEDTGRQWIDAEGNDWYEVTTRCTSWIGGEPGDPEPPKDPGGVVPPGSGGGGGDVKPGSPEHCDQVKSDMAAVQAALADALAQQQAAQDDLDRWTYTAASDHIAYVQARAEYDRAERELTYALGQYAAENDTVAEREVKSGVTISRTLPINPWLPWGSTVMGAQQQRDKARRDMDAAWARWSRSSDPAFRAAQEQMSNIGSVIATAPMRLEDLRRELKRYC
ncbi:MAG: hypothetical protein ABI336_01650 [Humibacillus sp.]